MADCGCFAYCLCPDGEFSAEAYARARREYPNLYPTKEPAMASVVLDTAYDPASGTAYWRVCDHNPTPPVIQKFLHLADATWYLRTYILEQVGKQAKGAPVVPPEVQAARQLIERDCAPCVVWGRS